MNTTTVNYTPTGLLAYSYAVSYLVRDAGHV